MSTDKHTPKYAREKHKYTCVYILYFTLPYLCPACPTDWVFQRTVLTSHFMLRRRTCQGNVSWFRCFCKGGKEQFARFSLLRNSAEPRWCGNSSCFLDELQAYATEGCTRVLPFSRYWRADNFSNRGQLSRLQIVPVIYIHWILKTRRGARTFAYPNQTATQS